LPPLPIPLTSSAVSTCGKNSEYLFSVGGITKKLGELNIVSMIYRLQILKPGAWERLKINLEIPLCDLGITKLQNPNELLIFGGWNYTSYDQIYKLTNNFDINNCTIEEQENKLPRGDFYIVNGCEINSLFENIKLIKGHQDILQLDTSSISFTYPRAMVPKDPPAGDISTYESIDSPILSKD
jgi:hypothetical protein